jgi:predicted RNase H-like HicB family nuclease
MRLQFTAVFEKVSLGYIAYIEELPGANTQGRTLEEARSNLVEAVEMTIEANRNLFEEEIRGKVMIKEPFAVLTA